MRTDILRLAIFSIVGAATLMTCGLSPLAVAYAADPTTLKVGSFGPPPGLGNPYKGNWRPGVYVWSAIFDGLTLVDGAGRPTPALATSWQNVDRTTWRFVVRSGVSFHNGEVFDARAVAETIKYVTSQDGAATPAGRLFRGFSAKVVGESAIEITTASPNPIVPNVVASLRVLAPQAWRDLGDEGFSKQPVGTGSYRLDKWNGSTAIMKADERSWRAPRVANLEVMDMPDRASRLEAFLSGQIDVMIGPNPDDISRIQAAGHTIHISAPNQASTVALQIAGPNALPAIKDRRVRQALNYAVDKSAMARDLFGGLFTVSSQPTTPSAFGYDPSILPYPYDPSKAKQLLADAGFPQGFSFTIDFYGDEGDIYQRLAGDLAKVGIKTEIRQTAFQDAVRKFVANTWDGHAFRHTWSVSPEMDAVKAMGHSSCLNSKPWYCDQAMSGLIERINNEFDSAKREKLLHELMRRYHEEAPALYLLNNPEINAINKRVLGFENSNSVVHYEKITLSQ